MDVGQVQSQVQQVGGVWQIATVELKNKYSALGEVEVSSPREAGPCSDPTLGKQAEGVQSQWGDCPDADDRDSYSPELWETVGPRGKIGKMKPVKKWKKLEICPVENSGGKLVKMGMGFQVADVRKPLVAVKRISEKGNLVQFGPQKEDNFIQNKQTRDKIFFREQGSSYIMDVQFENGEFTNSGHTPLGVGTARRPKTWCPSQTAFFPVRRKKQ